MTYILLILLLLNTSIFYSNIFNKKIEQTFFLGIFSYILILFIFGIFRVLNVGFVLILLLNIPALIYNIYYLIKNKSVINKNILTMGLILLFVSYIIIVWQSLGRLASAWDEFSHWALVVKNMYGLNNLGIGFDSTVMIKDYLSGTSLFQYFCVKLSGTYKESMLYIGMGLLLISLIIPVFSNFDKKKNFIGYVMFFVLFLIPTLFYPNVFYSLYVDAALGLTFAYSLYTYFGNRKNKLTIFDIINLMASYSMLIFIKDFGLVLLLISFFIVLIDNMFIKNKFKIKSLLKNNYLILLTPIPALLIKIIWLIALNVNGVISDGSTNSIFKTVKNILSFNLLDYQIETTNAFADAVFNIPLVEALIPITYVLVLIIVMVIGYFAIQNAKGDEKKSTKILITFLILGGVGYAALLYLAYISVFSEYEAVRLASFGRYMSSYALGAIYISIAIYINLSKSENKLGVFTMILLALFSINFNFTIILDMTYNVRKNVNNSNKTREEYKLFSKKTKKYVKKGQRTYFISTNDKGLDYYIARYELTPNKISDWQWSIGVPYYDEDIWTVYKSPDDWRKELIDGYTYVYLYDIDEQFIDMYSSLFKDQNIEDNQLYKVVKSDSYAILEFVE